MEFLVRTKKHRTLCEHIENKTKLNGIKLNR